MTSSVDLSGINDQFNFFQRIEQLSESLSIVELWNALEPRTFPASPDVDLACADIAMCAGDEAAAINRYENWLEGNQDAGAFLPFARTRIFTRRIMEPVLPNLFTMAAEDAFIKKLVGVGALFSLGRWAALEKFCDDREQLNGLDWRIAAAVGFAKAAMYDYNNASAFFMPAILQGHGGREPFNGWHGSISQAAEECAGFSRDYTAASRSAEKSLYLKNFPRNETAGPLDATKIDLFIKTCAKDEEFFIACLKSIDIFVSGFRRVVIVTDDDHDFHCPLKYDHSVHKVTVPTAPTTFGMPAGYRMQMVVKLSWMDYTDADAVVITDSDTIFTRPFTPEEMLKEGKPVWYRGDWHEGVIWRAGSELAVGAPMPFCYMREHPFIFTKDATAGFLEYIDNRFGCSIHDLFFAGKIPGKMCEFEILGGYLWHVSDHGYRLLEHQYLGIVRQYWSWGGFTDDVKANIEEHLRVESIKLQSP